MLWSWSFIIYTSGIVSLLCTLKELLFLGRAIYAYRLKKYFGGPKEIVELIGPSRYVVISGATDGIGLAYAKALALMGFNIVIIGRNEVKIQATKDMIININNEIIVKTIKVDFDSVTDDIYEFISKETEDIEVSMLINNVGVSYPHMMNFEKIDPSLCDKLIRVNSLSVARMCRLFIPRMMCSQYNPVIINVSSYSGISSTPYLAAYAASKAFTTIFSRALSEEYVDKNLIIQSVNPLLVATKMSGIKRKSLIVMDPDEFVAEALLSVGVLNESFGCLSHHLQHLVSSRLPTFIKRQIILDQKLKVDKKILRRDAEKND